MSLARLAAASTLALSLALPTNALAAPESTAPETAPPPAPTPTHTPEDKPSRDDDSVFGAGAMGGVGFPRVLSVEGFVTFDRLVLVGLEYGALPTVDIGGVKTSLDAVTADARVFPFRGAFFVGLRGGRQRLSLASTFEVEGLGAFSESLETISWIVNPRLGFLWRLDPGIVIGVEAGVQIPVAVRSTTSLDTGLGLEGRLTASADSLGRTVLPTVDLLRIGLAF